MATSQDEQEAVEQVVGRLLMHNTVLVLRVARLEAELAAHKEKSDGA